MFEHYKAEDLACKCGCGTNNVSNELVVKLNQMCHRVGRMLDVTSCCRCIQHNRHIKSNDDSSHVSSGKRSCTAVDISTIGSRERYQVLHAAIMVGFDRIGVGTTYVHVDVDTGKSPDVVWLYK